MIRTGTNYFVSITAALDYYSAQGPITLKDIVVKIADGAIHIGEPLLKPGQRLNLIDNDTRYEIEED